MIYDLHSHSNVSDGILSPSALVSRAKSKGVDRLALTDHDTVLGLSEAQAKADEVGIDLIPGIEFSTQWGKKGIHIVGLNVNVASATLKDTIAEQHKRRYERAYLIAERLAEKGVQGALDGAKKYAGNDVIGRPHFARYLIEQGFASDMNSAFQGYLGSGKAGDVEHNWLSLEAIVKAIVAAGGVAVIAHPTKYKLSRMKLFALSREFKEMGGQAIEVISGSQRPNDTYNMALIAKQLDIHASLGSDFHLPDQSWQELGVCGNLPPSCKPVWELWQ